MDIGNVFDDIDLDGPIEIVDEELVKAKKKPGVKGAADENAVCNDVNYLPDKTDKKIVINRAGAYIKFSDISASSEEKRLKLVRKIENYFTLKSMQIMGHIKQMKRCVVNKNLKVLIVPRYGVFEVLNKKYGLSGYYTKSVLSDGEDRPDSFKWTGSLRHNQQVVVDYINKNNFSTRHVRRGSAGCILNLEAGQGKTYIASYFIGQLKKKTAVILHSTSMVEQWANDLRACYGKDLKIGYYYAGKKIDGDIMLIIINSSVNDEFVFKDKTLKYPEFYSQFGFIIMDECHKYANKMGGKIFKRGQAPYMLGLSATPDENADKFDPVVWWGLGPVINAKNMTGYISTDNLFTGTVNRIMYYGGQLHTKIIRNQYTDMISVSETISMICEDEFRNNIIIDCIEKCLQDNLYTFVFADRREYLEKLRKKLIIRIGNDTDSDILVTKSDYVRIVGGAKNAELDSAAKHSKVIFTTYQYMGTGKSIPKMNALVLATPRKSKMKQYIKRIFRLGSDAKINRIIYDIVDMKLTIKNQWSKRKEFYTDNNFKIDMVKIRSDADEKTRIKAKNTKPIDTDNELQNKLYNLLQ